MTAAGADPWTWKAVTTQYPVAPARSRLGTSTWSGAMNSPEAATTWSAVAACMGIPGVNVSVSGRTASVLLGGGGNGSRELENCHWLSSTKTQATIIASTKAKIQRGFRAVLSTR